jgi:type IV pilus assembly protein PilA
MEYHKFLFTSKGSLYMKPGSGFTLLELMIVMLVMSVLAAIALPNLIRQVGKARESEAVQALSAVAFAQQGYFFENRRFATNYADLGVGISSSNYNFPDPQDISGVTGTRSSAIAIGNGLNTSRDYDIGIYYISSSYTIALCRGAEPGITTQVPSTPSGVCANGGVRLE